MTYKYEFGYSLMLKYVMHIPRTTHHTHKMKSELFIFKSIKNKLYNCNFDWKKTVENSRNAHYRNDTKTKKKISLLSTQ